HRDEPTGLVGQGDHVTLAHLEAGDGDALAVHADVAVPDELAGLGAAGTPAGAEGDVVEPGLEEPQQVLTGDALLAGGLLVEVGELLLHEAVDAAGLLLLAQLGEVLGALLAAGPAVIAGRVGPALDGALRVGALGAPAVELH